MTSPATPALEIIGVSKRFKSVEALHAIDLLVQPGEIVTLLGPNGAGKSTTINLVLGLLQPDEGQIRLFGQSANRTDSRQRVGVVAQSGALHDILKVRELIALVSSYKDTPWPIVELAGFTGVTALLDKTYGRLSGGQKRLVQFALACCGRPQLLVLDEPTVGLDSEARRALWAAVGKLRQSGCAVILTTHYLEEAEAIADRIVVIARGKVITDGSVDEIRSVAQQYQIRCKSQLNPDLIRAWPGIDSAEQEGASLRILTRTGDLTLRQLLVEDPGASHIELRPCSLEEAFEELIKEAA